MIGDACQPDMVAGGPHGADAVRAVLMFLIYEFEVVLHGTLQALASECDVDDEPGHSTRELLCAMDRAADGHVPRDVLEKLVAGCA
mgnify:CR=1 FL=1